MLQVGPWGQVAPGIGLGQCRGSVLRVTYIVAFFWNTETMFLLKCDVAPSGLAAAVMSVFSPSLFDACRPVYMKCAVHRKHGVCDVRRVLFVQGGTVGLVDLWRTNVGRIGDGRQRMAWADCAGKAVQAEYYNVK